MTTAMQKILEFYFEHNEEDFYNKVFNFYMENKMAEDDKSSKEFLINMIRDEDKNNEKLIEMIQYYIDNNGDYYFKEVVNFYMENKMVEDYESSKEYIEVLMQLNRDIDGGKKVSKLRKIITLIANVGTVYVAYKLIRGLI